MARRSGGASDRAWDAFAAIPPGLEGVLVEELDGLGVKARTAPGGASFRADVATLARVHQWSRCAGRVTLHVGWARATSLDELAAGVRALPWADYAWARQPLDVKVTSQRSRLRRREAVAKKVEHAIRDALRVPRKEGKKPARTPVGVLVRIEGDRAELRVDASGDLLHRRGWRREVGAAPIRENLASALLRVAEWRPGEALLDPFCGVGTIVIEAALRAEARPPSADRRFAWMDFPCVSRPPSPGPATPGGATHIVGSDIDPDQIRFALANARRARVELPFAVADALHVVPHASTGLLVANAPYGERVRGDLGALYRAFGRHLREHFVGWRVALLFASPAHARAIGLPLTRRATFSNGGIRVGVHVGAVR